MTDTDASVLVAVFVLLAWVCWSLDAPLWLVIVGPLTYVGLAVAVMSV